MTRLAAFERHCPDSVEGVTELLDSLGDEAIVYAGGTELFLLSKFGFAEYPHVIDLKGVEELRGIERSGGRLRIGATETHRSIERHPEVRRDWPALASMERGVGNLRVRTMGTIGGNLCFADPHSDPATFLLTVDGEIEARRGDGDPRRMKLEDFIVGPYENALEDGELLTSISVGELAPDAGVAHQKFILTERPAITAACHLRIEDGSLADVRLAVGSAGVRAARAEAAEGLLNGSGISDLDRVFEEAGPLAADAAEPVEDANGSVEYKRHVVAVVCRRVVDEAISAIGQENDIRPL
jgi:carbon-monoxide dehydrogenase medium subunit